MDYTSTFIRTKITAFDKTKSSDDTGEIVESQPSAPEVANISVAHLHLGSFKKAVPLAKFADGSEGNKPTYNEFRRMLEVFLNKFYQPPDKGYLRVQSNQEVISKLLLLRTIC